jgi:hypothetical protein
MAPERDGMLEIKKRYVVDEENRPIAVQIDLETFEKIEELLENRGLFELMSETEGESLDLDAAREYYRRLDKAR